MGLLFPFTILSALGWVSSSGRFITLRRSTEVVSHNSESQHQPKPQHQTKAVCNGWSSDPEAFRAICFCGGFLASKCKIKKPEKILLIIWLWRMLTQLWSIFPRTSLPAPGELQSSDKQTYRGKHYSLSSWGDNRALVNHGPLVQNPMAVRAHPQFSQHLLFQCCTLLDGSPPPL